MKNRQQKNIIFSIIAGVSILMILTVLWFSLKDYWFRAYHNPNKNFTVSYPASWKFAEDKDGAEVIFYSPLENKLDFFPENVNIVIRVYPGDPLDLKKYSDLAIHQMRLVFKENLVVVESVPMFLAGHPAHRFVFIGKGPEAELKFMCVWTIVGNMSYQVTYTALASKYDRYVDKVNKMIDSFKIK